MNKQTLKTQYKMTTIKQEYSTGNTYKIIQHRNKNRYNQEGSLLYLYKNDKLIRIIGLSSLINNINEILEDK